MKQNTSNRQLQGKIAEKYKYPSFATETASEYKYQMVTETVEWNTSKQFSAKETALRNVYQYSRIIVFFFFFFFLKRNECGETEPGSESKVF